MNPFRILLVEDDDDHAELALFHLKQAAPDALVERALDGEEAVVLMRRCFDSPDTPPFDLVLLDLNLPRCSGLEVLTQVRNKEAPCPSPVVVMSTSESERDKLAAYQNGVNAYVVKPDTFDQYRQLIQGVIGFWKNFNRLPERHP